MSGSVIDVDELERAILDAHEQNDAGRLAQLYHQAFEHKFSLGEVNASAFLLTQAYVFALESGHDSASALQKKLIELGREQSI